MSYTVDFLINFPELVKDSYKNMSDDDVDEWLKTIYNGVKSLLIARHSNKFPNFNDSELGRIVDNSFSYYCTQSMISSDVEGNFIWSAIALVHTGKQQEARDLVRNQLSEWVNTSTLNFTVAKLKGPAAAGEKFINSDGHQKKKNATKNKHQEIAIKFKKMIDGNVSKADAYSRLENSESLSKRQLQRIIKKYKNDI